MKIKKFDIGAAALSLLVGGCAVYAAFTGHDVIGVSLGVLAIIMGMFLMRVSNKMDDATFIDRMAATMRQESNDPEIERLMEEIIAMSEKGKEK